MEVWESPLWSLLDRQGEWVPWEKLRRCCPGGVEEVHSHIQTFVEAGFSLEEDTTKGYRVVKRPDRLFPPWIQSKLNTEVVGRSLLYAHTMRSTQDEAGRMARLGAPDGTVVLCEYQSEGRGRRGRRWISSPGSGVLMSVIIRSPGEANEAFVWTQTASVAVAEAVERAVQEPAWIKWPNDVYLRDRKLCGVLAEWQPDPSKGPFVVLGIGLNVLEAPEPERASICLREVSPNLPRRADLVSSILEALETWCKAVRSTGAKAVWQPWVRRAWLMGKSVTIEGEGWETEGRVEGFLPDGRLLMLTGQGQRRAFAAGDVRVHVPDSERRIGEEGGRPE